MCKISCRITPLVVLFLAASTLVAQVATGVYSFGTYDTPGIDTINVGNLNVHLSFPVLNKAGRGSLPFNASLNYESSVYYPATTEWSTAWAPTSSQFGWGSTTGLLSGQLVYNVSTYEQTYYPSPYYPVEIDCYYTEYGPFTYIDSIGTRHSFPSSDTQQFSYQDGYYDGWTCPTNSSPTWSGTAGDGSGYQLSVTNYTTGSITTPNGLATQNIGGAATTTDTNGNQLSTDGNGNFTDTTGNVVLKASGNSSSSQIYTYYDTNGNPQQVKVNYSSYTVQTAFGCSGVGEYGPLQNYLVSSIVYPDGSTYNFSYEPTPGVSGNVTGRLAGIQLPQGGWINYTYTGGSNGIVCGDGSAAGLTRTAAATAGSASSTVTYTRGTGTSSNGTNVVDGYGNLKQYTFNTPSNLPNGLAALFYESSRQIYQGTPSPSSRVIFLYTCYNSTSGSYNECDENGFTLPITEIDTYNRLDALQMDGFTITYDANSGLPTESEVYDFGGFGSRGALLRQEMWGYTNSVPYLLTGDVINDGSGNPASSTVYSYDESTPTPSSGVPQHTSVSTTRGNLTTVNQFSNNQFFNSPSYLHTTLTYEDTGSPLTSTTQNFTTTLSYDPSFVYQTGTQLPTPSSGVTLSSSASYDTANTGLPLTATDANSQVTTISSYDSMLRPTQVNFPDGGKTIWFWSPTETVQNRYQSSSTYGQTITQYDNYGRLSRTAIADGANGAAPWYLQDTCYDANGNVSFVSYRYSASSATGSKVCSGNGDSYSYDVLGRVTGMTRANSESRSYTYTARATQTVDENGVTRIVQVDGMGRPTIVCEISSNSTMPGSGSPTSCGTDISGTGFVTNYSYALATGTTTVTQGGQTRTFQTDWLGRPTSVTEPESGTTTYSYAYNSTGLVVTRQKPTANQSSASVLTTTTTQYDALGRVLSTNYSDGTPTRNFTYDQPNVFGGGVSAGSSKGRLSWATSSVDGNWVGTAYQYDPMGRITATDECLPSGCGNPAYDRWSNYTYDLAGDLLTSTDGGGTTSTYTVTPAGELLSLTSSLNNSTNPANILSSVVNGPNGPQSWTLGNGLSGGYSYDSLGRLNGGTVSSGGTQVYSFAAGWKGSQLQSSSDTVLGQSSTYGYDQFNRLTSRTVTAGTVQNLSWTYDRWGNRWTQTLTAGASAPQPSYSFNTANNQISGYTYDAAGNQTSDGTHSYTYDAEGNIAAVDGGSTGSYTYDALSNRVRTVANGATTEFVFNIGGQRVSEWNASTHAQLKGHYYWGSKPVGFYTTANDGAAAAHFEHQDWLGTERMRTGYNGGIEATITSLPWGDSQTTSGADTDAYHFAMTDYDGESNTDHAQFRQYSPTEGRWLRPDPYSGSYDMGNPQSMNRYEYAMNNPLSNIDPSGLDCITVDESGNVTGTNTGDCPGNDPNNEYYVDCDGCTQDVNVTQLYQDPSSVDLLDYCSATTCYDQDGNPIDPNAPITVPVDFIGYGIGFLSNPLSIIDNPQLLLTSSPGGGGAPNNGTQSDPYPKRLFGTHWCGPGGAGPTVNQLDAACKAHDQCYDAHGYTASSNYSLIDDPGLQACNQALCDAAKKSSDLGATRVWLYFSLIPKDYCK